MNKPRIAFILPDRIKEPIGGMGVNAKYLIKHLEKDFDFDVYAFPEENNIEYYHSCPNPLPRIIHHGLSTIAGQFTYMTELMKNKKPDIIHVADYTLYLTAVMSARALNVPLVVSVQLSAHLMEKFGMTFAININSPDGKAIHNTMKEIELLGLHEAKKIIHVSNVYKKAFSEIKEFDEKSIYIPNGVDLEEYSKDIKEYKKVNLPGENKIKVIFIGRFAKQKNVEALMNIKVPENIDLIFIGKEEVGNPLFEKIIKRTKDENNLHYLGPSYDSEKINLLHSADAVLIPSIHECHPIVMHEAMASGCIPIHSGAGDMIEILTDDFAINCGFTSESISNALLKLSKMNEVEIEEKKNKALETVKNYTWEKSAKQYQKIYNELLNN